MIVDSHCHVSEKWYEPAESLLFQMDRHRVERAMLVQLLGEDDNRYQRQCAARWPDRFVSIVGIDVARDGWDSVLTAEAEEGAWGARLRPVPVPGQASSPAAIWRRAAKLGLAISCIATMEQLADPGVAALLRGVTGTPVLLEHGAGLGRADQSADSEIFDRVLALADLPHVLVKLPAIGQVEGRALRLPRDGRTLTPGAGFARVRALAERFGARRILWGSDFPVVSTREGYGNALAWTREALSDFPAEDLAMMFGGTAGRLLESGGANR